MDFLEITVTATARLGRRGCWNTELARGQVNLMLAALARAHRFAGGAPASMRPARADFGNLRATPARRLTR